MITVTGLVKHFRSGRGQVTAIDFEDAARAMPHELSGGEIQRVSVARAIAHRPKLLLADEPTASLDTVTGERIASLLYTLSRETGCTLVMATHDRRLAGQADRIIRLRDGAIEKEDA